MSVQRIKLRGTGYYHIYSRLVLGEFLLTDKKEKFLEITKKVAYFSGVEVLTYAIMDSHFHLLIKVLPVDDLTEEVVIDRYRHLYGDDEADDLAKRWDDYKKAGNTERYDEEFKALTNRMGDISHFTKNIKQRFTQWYLRTEKQRGTIWQGRFGSTLIEGNDKLPEIRSLVQVATYIEENPVRAKMVEKSGDYAYTGYGAAKRGNEEAKAGIGKLYNCKPDDAMVAIAGMLATTHFKSKNDDLVRSLVIGSQKYGLQFTHKVAKITEV